MWRKKNDSVENGHSKLETTRKIKKMPLTLVERLFTSGLE